MVHHLLVVFRAAEGMVPVLSMGLATPAERKVGGIVGWKLQFLQDGIAEVTVLESVAGDAVAHLIWQTPVRAQKWYIWGGVRLSW